MEGGGEGVSLVATAEEEVSGLWPGTKLAVLMCGCGLTACANSCILVCCKGDERDQTYEGPARTVYVSFIDEHPAKITVHTLYIYGSSEP